MRSTHGEKAKPRRALRADRGSSCSARGEKSRAAEMRRVNPELTRESPRFISARRPPIGRFRSSPIRLIFSLSPVFLSVNFGKSPRSARAIPLSRRNRLRSARREESRKRPTRSSRIAHEYQVGRRSVLARFPARLPELFCHHRVCVQARCKRDWRRVGHRVVVPGSERTPLRRGGDDEPFGIVAEPSPATRASSLPPRARGRSDSRPPLARPTHAREIRFTNNDNGSAGARVAAPGRDALPPASRRATIVPRAELRASDRFPLPLRRNALPVPSNRARRG